MTKHEPFYADPIIAAALAEPDTAYLDRLRAYNETLRAQRAVIFDRPHRPCTCPDWAEGEDEGLVVIDEQAADDWIASRDAEYDVESAA